MLTFLLAALGAALFTAQPASADIIPDYFLAEAGVVLDENPNIGGVDIKDNPAAFGAALG
ncbi:hypothetical protein [Chlorobium sp.]|uniref:hypothetical protein n=1 Tax=Chlorobium sp. TaxID=1095 RepID=UPI003C3C48B3